MLRCADGSFYVGCTTNLDQRIGEHQAGEGAGYTSTRRPVKVVWCEEFQSIHDAIDGVVAREEAGADRQRLAGARSTGVTRTTMTAGACFETRLRRSSA